MPIAEPIEPPLILYIYTVYKTMEYKQAKANVI